MSLKRTINETIIAHVPKIDKKLLEVLTDSLMGSFADERVAPCNHNFDVVRVKDKDYVMCRGCGLMHDPTLENILKSAIRDLSNTQEREALDRALNNYLATTIETMRIQRATDSENQKRIVVGEYQQSLQEVEDFIINIIQEGKTKLKNHKAVNQQYDLGFNNGRADAFNHILKSVGEMFNYARNNFGEAVSTKKKSFNSILNGSINPSGFVLGGGERSVSQNQRSFPTAQEMRIAGEPLGQPRTATEIMLSQIIRTETPDGRVVNIEYFNGVPIRSIDSDGVVTLLNDGPNGSGASISPGASRSVNLQPVTSAGSTSLSPEMFETALRAVADGDADELL